MCQETIYFQYYAAGSISLRNNEKRSVISEKVYHVQPWTKVLGHFSGA